MVVVDLVFGGVEVGGVAVVIVGTYPESFRSISLYYEGFRNKLLT